MRDFFFHTLDTRSVYVLEYAAFSNFGENPTKNDPSFKVSNDKGVRLTYTSTHRRAYTYEFIHTRNGFKIPKVLQYLHVFRSIIPAKARLAFNILLEGSGDWISFERNHLFSISFRQFIVR